MPRRMDLSHVFEVLRTAGIRVGSLRNKTNRLEELLVRLTGSAEQQTQVSPAAKPASHA